jgi:hypothetical protein
MGASRTDRSYKEYIEIRGGVGARASKADDKPSVKSGEAGTGTIIISSSVSDPSDTGTGKRSAKSSSDGSIKGISKSRFIFSISTPDYSS